MWTVFQALGEREAEDARRAAEDKNTKLLKQWNEDMLGHYDTSRGSTGKNAFLSQNPALAGAETMMAGNAMDYYQAADAFYGTPEERIAKFNAAVNSTGAAREGAMRSVNDIYSGKLLTDRTASLAPVLEARTSLAKTGRQGFYDALNARLNAIAAGDRTKGYGGTGSFAQNRLLGATVGANQAAAAVEAQAVLENAAQQAALEDSIRELQIQNVNLPYQLANANVQAVGMPVAAAGQSLVAQSAPLEQHRIGYIAPPYQALQGPLLKAPKKSGWQTVYEGLHEGSNDIMDLAMTAASMYFGGGLGGGMADFSDNKAPTATRSPDSYDFSSGYSRYSQNPWQG